MISHDVTITSMRLLYAGQGNVTAAFSEYFHIYIFVINTGNENVPNSKHQLYFFRMKYETVFGLNAYIVYKLNGKIFCSW